MDNKLPKDWKIKTLGEVCKIIMGQSPPSDTYNENAKGMPFFQGKAEFTDLYPIVKKYCSKPTKVAEPCDILLSVRAPVGTTNIANQQCCIGRGLAAIRFENYKYGFYFLRSIQQELDSKGTGTTFRAISGETIRETLIPLPPLQTQQAIVSKIEELFSELDKGIEDLKTAQQQLKTYRQSVLKWAFEGKKKKLFEDFIESSQNGLSKRSGENGEDFNVLRLADIKNNIIVIDNPRKIKMTDSEILKYKLNEDDLICIRVNGSKDLVGKIIFITNSDSKNKWAFCDHFIRFTVKDNFNSKFIYHYFQTIEVRKFIHDNMVTSAGQNTVSQVTIKNVLVPYCNIEEQHFIVQEIESRLSVADKMEESIMQSLQQAEALRQSILKKAFSGQLL